MTDTDPETDEQRADRLETERQHAAGDHMYCDVDCEAKFPSEILRNGILAKGYPGTAGMLDELLRRAGASLPAVSGDLREQIARASYRGFHPGGKWEMRPESDHEAWRLQADVILPVVQAELERYFGNLVRTLGRSRTDLVSRDAEIKRLQELLREAQVGAAAQPDPDPNVVMTHCRHCQTSGIPGKRCRCPHPCRPPFSNPGDGACGYPPASRRTKKQPTPAPAEDILADLIARCPEHGNATESWPECRCDAARRAAADIAGATDPEVVAYRSHGGRVLRCLRHKPEDMEGFVPVAAEDLEDGGVCTFLGCGADVLITEGN